MQIFDILAYGGFSGDIDKDMNKIYAFIIPKIFLLIVEFSIIYIVSKKSISLCILSLLSHCLLIYFIFPMMGVMGNYGPHHVGDEIIRECAFAFSIFILFIPFYFFTMNHYKEHN